MRYLFVIMMFLLAFSTSAKQPKYLKDATITVKLKSGKTYTFNANDYKIVKRTPKLVIKKKAVPKMAFKKHRFSLYGGMGPHGLKTVVQGLKTTIKRQDAPVFGFGYNYKLNKTYDIGGTILNNKTYLFNVGISFK